MKPENKKSIEEYISDLGEITEKMNQSDISLDESVALYKKGMEVAKSAQELLSRYEQEIEIINKSADDGGLKTDG